MTLKPFVNSSESWNTWSASWVARCFNHWRESSFPVFATFYNLQFNYDCLTSVQELQIVPINICSLFITTPPCLLRNSLCFQFKKRVFEKKNMGIRWVQNSAKSSRDNKMFQIWGWYARLNCSYAKELPGIQNKNTDFWTLAPEFLWLRTSEVGHAKYTPQVVLMQVPGESTILSKLILDQPQTYCAQSPCLYMVMKTATTLQPDEFEMGAKWDMKPFWKVKSSY